MKLEAAAARMSVAGYLASGRLGTEAASGPRSKRTTPTIEGKLLARLVFEQNHIGSNINQRTRALNELRLIAREMGADRLERIIADEIERTREIDAQLTRALAANLRALGDEGDE